MQLHSMRINSASEQSPAYCSCQTAAFSLHQDPHSLLVQVWLGHSQSLRACQGGLLLNVAPRPCVFWAASPVEEFLKSALGPGALAPDMRARSGKKLANMRVRWIARPTRSRHADRMRV